MDIRHYVSQEEYDLILKNDLIFENMLALLPKKLADSIRKHPSISKDKLAEIVTAVASGSFVVGGEGLDLASGEEVKFAVINEYESQSTIKTMATIGNLKNKVGTLRMILADTTMEGTPLRFFTIPHGIWRKRMQGGGKGTLCLSFGTNSNWQHGFEQTADQYFGKKEGTRWSLL